MRTTKTWLNSRVKLARWTPREIKLLGIGPNAVVARKIGRSVEAVSLKRQALGIGAPLQPPWSDEEIKLLGTRPDREVGKLIGRSLVAVHGKRLVLGISSWKVKTTKRAGPADPEKVKLLYGPYRPPRPRRGKFLICEMRGTVKVGNYSDGPIPWPMKWRTRSLILCGDLVRAVQQESALAVAHHWAVCTDIVSKWRRSLEVEPITAGTRRLKSYVQSEALTPALLAHLSRIKTGRPHKLTPGGKARLLAALRRPKPAHWFQSMAGYFAAHRGKPVKPGDRVWTPKEESLLGTKPDREIARLLKRSFGAIRARRYEKEIPCAKPTGRKRNS